MNSAEAVSGVLTVLIVEDRDEVWNQFRVWFKRFGERIKVLAARTIQEARELFRAHPDIAVIAVDYEVPEFEGQTVVNTIAFVEEIRTRFPGPMIAMGSFANHRKELMAHGCSVNCGGSELNGVKHLLPKVIEEVTGIKPDPPRRNPPRAA